MIDKKQKILFVHDYPPVEGGGLELNTFRLAKELVKKGNFVTIATTRFFSETFNQVPIKNFEGVKIKGIRDRDNLAGLIDANDIIHVQATFSLRFGTMETLRICREIGKEVFVTLHTGVGHIPFSRLSSLDLREKNSLLKEFKELLGGNNVRIILPEELLKRSLEAIGVKNKISVIRNGIYFPENNNNGHRKNTKKNKT